MAWTKADIIRQAYAEIGKGAYEFDLQPEDMQTGLRQLDAMLGMWGGTLGIRIGFSGGNGFGDVSAETEVPLWAVEALYYNLAVRLAPAFGKTPSPVTLMNAKAALDAVRVRTVTPEPRRIRGYAGGGNVSWGVAPMPEQIEPVATGPDNTFEFG